MSNCHAALNVSGVHYHCEVTAPHPGWSHMNKEAEAIWCSDAEARDHAGKKGKKVKT